MECLVSHHSRSGPIAPPIFPTHRSCWPSAETHHSWFVSPPPQRTLRQWFMGQIHLHLTFSFNSYLQRKNKKAGKRFMAVIKNNQRCVFISQALTVSSGLWPASWRGSSGRWSRRISVYSRMNTASPSLAHVATWKMTTLSVVRNVGLIKSLLCIFLHFRKNCLRLEKRFSDLPFQWQWQIGPTHE